MLCVIFSNPTLEPTQSGKLWYKPGIDRIKERNSGSEVFPTFTIIILSRMTKILFSAIFVLLTSAACAQLEHVTVRKVHDAQVLTVYADLLEFTMILVGMTCPGLDQPYGQEAKELVEKAVLNKTVRVDPLGVVGNSIIVAVMFDEQNNLLNNELISKGLARADEREPELLKLEAVAKSKKLGIWKDNDDPDLETDWEKHHLIDGKPLIEPKN